MSETSRIKLLTEFIFPFLSFFIRLCIPEKKRESPPQKKKTNPHKWRFLFFFDLFLFAVIIGTRPATQTSYVCSNSIHLDLSIQILFSIILPSYVRTEVEKEEDPDFCHNTYMRMLLVGFARGGGRPFPFGWSFGSYLSPVCIDLLV